MKYIGIILFLVSCIPQEEIFIEPALIPYWNQFQYEAERLGVNLPRKNIIMAVKGIKDMTLNGQYCQGLTWNGSVNNPTATIYINENLFKGDFSTYSIRIEATIFHELGHAFGRHHNSLYYDSAYIFVHPKKGYSQTQSKSWPTSLLTTPNYYKYYLNGEKREYYLKELFGLEDIKEKEGVVILKY